MFWANAQADLADKVLRLFEPNWFWATATVIVVLAVIGLSPVRLEADLGSHGTISVYIRRIMLGMLAALLTVGLGCIGMFYSRLGTELANPLMTEYAWRWVPFLLSASVIGFAGRLVLHRYLQPRWSKFLKRFRIVQDTDQLSDIREEIEGYKPLDYLPADYHQADQIFMGLTPDGQPIYCDLKEWYETNKMVMGGTRFGKGIAFQIWMEQMIARGDNVIYVDPKEDKFLPHVMRQAADRAGRRFIALDLVDPTSRGSWAPFVGGSAADRRARFFDIMELLDRGTDADHYKTLAREQVSGLFQNVGTPTTLLHLATEVIRLSDDIPALSTLRGRLKEWSDYPKLSPKAGKGFSIEQSLLNNAVVYVRGSLDDNVVRSATRCFIMECIQEIRRLQHHRTSHCALFIDELKFVMSDTILKALATTLGFNSQIGIAFQNYGDIESPDDQRINGRAALKSVKINCQIKVVTGGTDAESAEDIAANTGTARKRVVMREQTEINRSGGETWARHRQVGDQEETLVTENAILSFDKRVAVLMRVGKLAEIITLSPVPVQAAAPPQGPATIPMAAATP
jgi:hypothetical protein